MNKLFVCLVAIAAISLAVQESHAQLFRSRSGASFSGGRGFGNSFRSPSVGRSFNNAGRSNSFRTYGYGRGFNGGLGGFGQTVHPIVIDPFYNGPEGYRTFYGRGG
jgi:uncharacterized membrane protein